MSNLATEVQNLDLDEDQKLLRKYGVEDNTGALMETGKDAILALLYKDTKNRKTLVDALKKLDEANQAKVKCCDKE